MFLGPQWPHFDGFIHIRYAAPPYSAHISSIYLLPFGKVWLGSVCVEFTQNLRKACVNSGPIFIRLWTNVHEILGQCRRPLIYVPKPLPDCLRHVSFTRNSPSSLEVVEKPNKCKTFCPHFWEKRPQLSNGRLLARFTVHRFAKLGCVPFVDLRLRSLAIN